MCWAGARPEDGAFPGRRRKRQPRVAWIERAGGFGFDDTTAADGTARRVMEFDALNRGAAPRNASRIACISLSLGARRDADHASRWRRRRASALAALGMAMRRRIFVAHNDEEYAHVHIVASKINPGDRPRLRPRRQLAQAFGVGRGLRARAWRHRQHAPARCATNCAPRSARATPAPCSEAMTKQRSTFTAEASCIARSKKKFIRKIGATATRSAASSLSARNSATPCWRMPSSCSLRDERGRPTTRYTTRAVLEAELHVLRAANGLAGRHSARPRRAAARRRAQRRLWRRSRASRRRAFRHATGEEGLAIIDGQAGTGKSYTIAADPRGLRSGRASRDRARPDQYRRKGHEPATVSRTRRPCIASCSRSTTAAPAGIRQTVVIVDEAAMLDTKLMAMVTAHAHEPAPS